MDWRKGRIHGFFGVIVKVRLGLVNLCTYVYSLDLKVQISYAKGILKNVLEMQGVEKYKHAAKKVI